MVTDKDVEVLDSILNVSPVFYGLPTVIYVVLVQTCMLERLMYAYN